MNSLNADPALSGSHLGNLPDREKLFWLFPLSALIAICLSSIYSYPVFHSLAEGFSVFISFGIFVLAWNTRHYMKDDFLLFLGIIALCNGVIDTFHLMAYKGVTLFSGYDSNLPTSLWIASRYLQSILLLFVASRLSSPAKTARPIRTLPVFLVCGAVTTLLAWSIFAGIFPACYVEGTGLTPFKKISEGIISLLFAWSCLLLWQRRSHFETGVARLLLAAVVASLGAELSFIFYVDVFDLSNFSGHAFKIASQYFIYCAIIKKGLRQPLDLLFHKLHANQHQLQQLNESLESTVRERTAQLERDIEERKLVEASLAQQTSLLTGLLNSIPDLIFFKDINGVYLGCNPEFARFAGHPLAEIAGRTDYDLFPEDVAASFRMNDRITMEQGLPRHNEEWVSYPDGTAVLLDTFKARLRAMDGEAIGVLGVSRDITGRKQLEESVAKSENLFRTLALHAPVGIFQTDARGDCTYVNKSWCQLAGLTYEQAMGSGWSATLHPEDRDKVCAQRLDASRSRHEFTLEYRFLPPEGALRWVCAVAAPLLGDTGEVAGYIGSVVDITQKKAHEQEIERLKDLYAALSQVNQAITRIQTREELFREIPRLLVEFGRFTMVWIGWRDPDTHEVAVVSQQGDASGYLQGIRIFADDRPEGRGPTGSAIREGKTCVCNEFSNDTNTLPWRESAARADWHSSAAFPIRQSDKVKGALMVYAQEKNFFGAREVALLEEAAMNISFALDNIERETVRQQGEVELRKLSQAVQQSPVTIVITDPLGIIEFVNPRFTQLTGYEAAEAVGKNPRSLKSGHISPEMYRDLWSTISRGDVWEGELLNKKKSGESFMEHCTVSPIKNNEGITTHYLAIGEDITDQNMLKEQLLQSQKMEAIGRLAGGIAHDFNNILTVIMGYCNILDLRSNLNDDDKEALAQIYAASEKAAQLTRGLLAFSRKQVLDPKPVNLNDMVHHVQKFLVRIIGEDVQLNSICKDATLNVKADAGQIEQVLMNLATNARDAMPKGGVLTIETGVQEVDESFGYSHGCVKPGRYAFVSVSDTGTGMDDATRKRIFEPFFTTKEVGKGTGLGMAIVHGIVNQHNGFIYFHSEQGKGTKFNICLPLMDKIKIPDERELPAEPLQKGTETILIAEDDASVRKIIESILTGHGYEVILAEDGQDAVEKFNANRSKVMLVLMDVIMPKKNGMEAYQEIRNLDSGVKVLFTSGYTSDFIQSRVELEAGADLIMKPVKPQELLRLVRKMLDV